MLPLNVLSKYRQGQDSEHDYNNKCEHVLLFDHKNCTLYLPCILAALLIELAAIF